MEEISPGRYIVKFEGAENGLYRLREGDLETVVALGPAAPKEFEDAISTGDILASFATATKGAVRRLSDGVPELRLVRQGRVASGRSWIGLTPRAAYVTVDIRLRPIGSALIFMLLAAAFMVFAWRREGR